MRKTFVLLVCLFSSCKKEVLPSNNLMLMSGKFDGQNFRSQDLNSYYYNGGLYSPSITLYTNSKGMNVSFRFVGNVLSVGEHSLSKLDPTALEGIECAYSDVRNIVDPEFFVPYRSIHGAITINQIDTGAIGYYHGVFTKLEASFYFDTDTIGGKWIHVDEGKISYQVR